MKIARLLLKLLAPKARSFEDSTKDPVKIQLKILNEYLSRNRNTEYGTRYGFSRIDEVSEYQKIVPLTDYETLRPYIARMEKGEPNILTSDKVTFFSTTTGTTDKPKFIPETKFSSMKKSEVMDLWGYYIARDHPDIFDGKILAVISPEIEGHTESGTPCGAESGHGYRHLSPLIKKLYALPDAVFEIADYESRYYAILRISMEKDITSIATLNPITILLLCHKIELWKEALIKDIEEGTISREVALKDDIRAAIEKTLRPNPGRAGELRSILNEKGKLIPKYFWPRTKLIECWKGGSVKPYLKDLPKYFGDVPVRDFGCLSSEARSSIPMSDEGAGGVLAINVNFYEFIRKEDMGLPAPRTYLCHELEPGKEYFIIVTTPSGLYRYNIDDIIRVDGFFNKTPVIEFIQKGLSATSATGEKLYESHVVNAINKALEKNKVFLKSFTACIQWEEIPRYAFLVEFDGEAGKEAKTRFLHSIEEELYLQNTEYREKRKAQLLAPPLLKVVQQGEFERYRMKKVAEGAHDGQFKLPELTADAEFQKNFTIAEELSI